MNKLSITGLIVSIVSGPLLALDPSIAQLAVSVAPEWDSPSGKLQLFEREGKGWRATSPRSMCSTEKVVLHGDAEFLGTNEPGPQKTERDKRAPAGVFKIGMIYTYDPALPAGARYPFHTMTEADAWIDDPTLPHYNQTRRCRSQESAAVVRKAKNASERSATSLAHRNPTQCRSSGAQCRQRNILPYSEGLQSLVVWMHCHARSINPEDHSVAQEGKESLLRSAPSR